MADQIDLMSRLVWLNYFTAQSLLGKQAKQAMRRPPKPMPRPQSRQKQPPKKFTSTQDAERLINRRRKDDGSAT